MKRIVSIAAAVALATAGLAGCSSQEPAAAPGKTPAAGQQQQMAPGQPEGAAKDLRDAKCTANPQGEWSLVGKLSNTSDKDAEYTVKASVTHKQGGTVVASKETTQKVAKGATAELKVEKFAKTSEPADQLLCVMTTTVKRG